MSKQYVAVTVYKILRDNAPDTIEGCERNVKHGGCGRFPVAYEQMARPEESHGLGVGHGLRIVGELVLIQVVAASAEQKRCLI